ncbi:MAG: hypothetical protein H2184_14265 [Candidatus Galacturonibacter soehngenii]|nr:hypothetical protein [Candidatus Galacturonibacter soehngenii]
MEMTYDGTMVMPSGCTLMNEEEMTYLEGGGTIKVIASKETVKKICLDGVALISTAISAAFTGPVLAKLVAGKLASIVFNYIMDACGVKYTAINTSWTGDWLPKATLNLNKLI